MMTTSSPTSMEFLVSTVPFSRRTLVAGIRLPRMMPLGTLNSRGVGSGSGSSLGCSIFQRARLDVVILEGSHLFVQKALLVGGRQLKARLARGFLFHEVFLEAAHFQARPQIDAHEVNGPGDHVAVGQKTLVLRVLQHGEDFERRRHGLDLVLEDRVLANEPDLALVIAETFEPVAFDDDVRLEFMQLIARAWC